MIVVTIVWPTGEAKYTHAGGVPVPLPEERVRIFAGNAQIELVVKERRFAYNNDDLFVRVECEEDVVVEEVVHEEGGEEVDKDRVV